MSTKWKVILALLGILILAYILSKVPSREIRVILPQKAEARELGYVGQKKAYKRSLAPKTALLTTYQKLDLLSFCESGQKEQIKVLDTNGKYSYGLLMFQRGTFDFFGEKYGLQHDDIYSRKQQLEIAKRMIEDGLIYHWRNCAKKQGLI